MNNDIGINTFPARTAYPIFGGPSLGQVANPTIPDNDVSPVNAASKSEVTQAVSVGALGNPLVWWVTLVFLLFALMFIAKRWGTEGSNFANLRLSFYNLVVIGLAAVIFITLGKAAATRFKIPGLSTIMLAV